MKIVIDIDEDLYNYMQTEGYDEHLDKRFDYQIRFAVKKGTPLPKEHGRLGDLDKLEKEMTDYIKPIPLPYHEAERLVLLMNYFDDAPTIIEADKGVLEKINEKQDSLRATCKAWDEVVEKDGYVN